MYCFPVAEQTSGIVVGKPQLAQYCHRGQPSDTQCREHSGGTWELFWLPRVLLTTAAENPSEDVNEMPKQWQPRGG